ncbi:hypothetical protein [Paraburkholderia sp. J76]|uniref:hypothetical protein n=1 Tax=Paraburkholderia sp. J76 TaxID=2805439 RepID=UPI002ABD2240|nr:hypothetical protein [Paraburkholderia sp. J76]
MKKHPVTSVLVAALFGLACHAAVATPVDGEEKCSPNGHVLRYRDYNQSWNDTYARCSGSGGSGEDGRRGYSSNGPTDGDEKCSPDGHVLRYRDYNHSWNDTYARCR